MTSKLFNLHAALLTLAAAVFPLHVYAQGAYPSKPITVIVPFAAGGSTDVAARMMVTAMSKVLGQNMVVEYVTGASGTIGMNKLARAPADGYTIGVARLVRT
jgi:tripartite-type tricarboxylate transporter receptor subunit TctC